VDIKHDDQSIIDDGCYARPGQSLSNAVVGMMAAQRVRDGASRATAQVGAMSDGFRGRKER
jgi:hypothetical protein